LRREHTASDHQRACGPARQAHVLWITHDAAPVCSALRTAGAWELIRGGGACHRVALREWTDRCLLKRWPRQFSLAGVGIWAVGRLATLCCLSLRIKAHSSPKRSPPVTSIPRSPFHRNLITVCAAQPDCTCAAVRCSDPVLAFAIGLIARPGQSNGGVLLLTRALGSITTPCTPNRARCSTVALHILERIWLCKRTVCAALPVKRRRNSLHTVA
jgi:hypothetical protein